MRIAVFGYGDPDLEGCGIRLIRSVSAQLRAEFAVPDETRIPVGPDFDYRDCPELFLSRVGRGPLHVAWDTNLLIDYFEHGRALWEHTSMPDLAYGRMGEDLEALQLLVALWVIRDIRFHIPSSVIDDARKVLSESRREARIRAFNEFSAAIRLVEAGEQHIDKPSREGLLYLPDRELQCALAKTPRSDRQLLTEAVARGVHVFMTRDDGVLACADDLRPFGLLLASPGDLLEILVGYGAFNCLLAPRYAYWPLPDQGRVAHLIRALG